MTKIQNMAAKKLLSEDQESLADALFPADVEDYEEAILSIPPHPLRNQYQQLSPSTTLQRHQKT
jgi:hypothetical protein